MDSWQHGGAIDMKIYHDDSPLDLAVKTDPAQPPAITSLIVETLDKVSLAPQNGLHQLAAAAELKQQAEEEEMMDRWIRSCTSQGSSQIAQTSYFGL